MAFRPLFVPSTYDIHSNLALVFSLIQQINAGHARVGCAECQESLRYANVKSIVSKTTLTKYDKNLLKAFIEEDEDFYYCVSTLEPCQTEP